MTLSCPQTDLTGRIGPSNLLPPKPLEKVAKANKRSPPKTVCTSCPGCLLHHPVGLFGRRGVPLPHLHLVFLSRRCSFRRWVSGWRGCWGFPPTTRRWRRRPPPLDLLLGLPLPWAHVRVCKVGATAVHALGATCAHAFPLPAKHSSTGHLCLSVWCSHAHSVQRASRVQWASIWPNIPQRPHCASGRSSSKASTL